MVKHHLYGSNSNNYFAGTKDADFMQGFGGNDNYIVNNVEDIVIESSNGGTDTIKTYVSMTVPYNVEKVYVIGPPWVYGYHVNVTGNSQDNFINGNCGYNKIKGLEGNDTLLGGTGNDTIYGGSGNDRLAGGLKDDSLYGGSGNDTIYGDSGNDRLAGGLNSDRLSGGNGNDTMYGGSGDDKLTGGLNNDHLYGDKGNDTIYGGSGNDRLTGGLNNDHLYGNNGDDRYYYNKGDGIDTIYDHSGYDSLKFNNIESSDVNFYKHNSDLVIDIKHSNGEVIIDNYFDSHAIENITFSNGHSYDYGDINHIVQH